MTTAFSGFGFTPAGGADCCTCEAPDCNTRIGCCLQTTPFGWKANVGSIGSLSPASTCDDCCGHVGGDYKLIPPSHTEVYNVDTDVWSQSGIDSGNRSAEGGGSFCQWVSFQYNAPLTPNLRYRLLEKVCGDCETDTYRDLLFFPIGPNNVPLVTLRLECAYRDEFSGTGNRLLVWIAIGEVTGSGAGLAFQYGVFAEYSTGWITEAAMTTLLSDALTDPAANPITLDLQTYTGASLDETPNANSPVGCDFPATIEVTPDTEANQRVYAGCDNQCDPAFTDGDGILVYDGTLGGVAVKVCLGRGYNDTLASLTWQGFGSATYSCGDKDFSILIYCGLLNPSDTERQWLIKFTNVTDGTSETFPLAVINTTDPVQVTFSETTTIFCGSAADVADIQPCDAASVPFADCCTDPDDRAALCCLADDTTVSAQGGIEESFPGGCDNPACATSLGEWGWNYGNLAISGGGNLWSESRYYWHGPLGFDDGLGTFSFYEGVLSCGPSGWEAVIVTTGTGDVLEVGTARPGFTYCATPSGTIAWGLATDTCCGGGAGTFTTTLG